MKQIFDFYQYSQEINHINEMSSELAGIDKLGDQHPMSKTEEIKNFIFAGKAIFTIQSSRSGIYFTYMMKLPSENKGMTDKAPPKKDLYFVGVLRGPNNESDYSYLGIVVRDGNSWKFTQTKKSQIKPDSLSCVAFKYFFDRIVRNHIDPQMKFFHMNLCGKCGRTLTTPESVELGIGPVCAGRMSEEEEINKDRFNKLTQMNKEWKREEILDARKKNNRKDYTGIS